MVNETMELSSRKFVKIIDSGYGLLTSFEMVIRKRDLPSKPSSSEILKHINSMYGFPMNVERMMRRRNSPSEP